MKSDKKYSNKTSKIDEDMDGFNSEEHGFEQEGGGGDSNILSALQGNF